MDKLDESIKKQLLENGECDEGVLFEWRAKSYLKAYFSRIEKDAESAKGYLSHYEKLLQANQG